MQFTTISNILLGSSLICAVAWFILWRRRQIRGARMLSFLMLSMFIWGLAESLEFAAVETETKLLFAKIGYFGVTTSPVFLFLFSYQYLNQRRQGNFPGVDGSIKQPQYLGLAPILWIVPVITLFLAWTNEYHHLLWTGYHFVDAGPQQVMIYGHGTWFWVNMTFTYMLLALSSMMLIMAAIHFRNIFKQQAWAVLVSVPLPIISNLLYIFFPEELRGIDLTPVGFAISGLILTIGIYNFYLMDITPFARETLMEYLPEGIIVLDPQNRVIDLNSAVNKMLGPARQLQIGDTADHLLKEWVPPEHLKAGDGSWETMIDLMDAEDDEEDDIPGPKRFYELCITPFKLKGNIPGRILIFTDITDRIANEDLLSETNEKLNAQLVEIHILKDQIEELAVRDALTGLYNRRFLNETLTREFARAGREHYSISLAMIDVDHFKIYNDTFGHHAGDEVLVRLARHLVENLREGDVVCRYGGEEFVVLLPFVNTETAENRINDLRISFGQIRHRPDDLHGVTFSAGIASFPQHGAGFEEVLEAADRALYSAKQSGRNRISIIDLTAAFSDRSEIG